MSALRMASTISKLSKIIGYKFNYAPYPWEALQAPGSVLRTGEISGSGRVRHSIGYERLPDGNRRLAVLGDTVLRLAIVEDWYRGEEVRGRRKRAFKSKQISTLICT